ncbi:hypothetical protein BGX24_003640, partial [Mortierella sp. AD032]
MPEGLLGFAITMGVMFALFLCYIVFQFTSSKDTRESRRNRYLIRRGSPRPESLQPLQKYGDRYNRSSTYSLAPPSDRLSWNNPEVILNIELAMQEQQEECLPFLASPPPTYKRVSSCQEQHQQKHPEMTMAQAPA